MSSSPGPIQGSITFPGPDWTRQPGQEMPDSRMAEVMRASAFGRAKGTLVEALQCADPLERESRVDRLLMRLVDYALDGADVHTILRGLLE